MSNRDLTPFVAQAQAIYLTEWEGLRPWARVREVTPATLLDWMGQIRHEWGNYRSTSTHATAALYELRISYNPLTCESMEDDLLLDLVLHEMGHLFCNWFIAQPTRGHFGERGCGHDYRWQNVGAVVGYAWVGCTGDDRRRAYIRAAKEQRLLRSLERALEKAA